MAEDLHEQPEPHFYTREFKLEAVRLSENSEQSVAQIARDVGVPARVRYRWRRARRAQGEQGRAQGEQGARRASRRFPAKAIRANSKKRTVASGANWTCSSRSARS
ncbi:MAG TPA: transposase [Ktedonobacterales bacterium]